METYYGTSGEDKVLSPVGRSTYYLLGGDDVFWSSPEPRGKWGDLKGEADIDIAYLGAGDDQARINSEDTVYAGSGNDTVTAPLIYGSFWYSIQPRSRIDGGTGNDLISYASVLIGGQGDDTLISYGGRVDGGAGDDVYDIDGFVRQVIDREGRSVIDIEITDEYERGPMRIVTGDGRDVINVYREDDGETIIRSGDRADIITSTTRGAIYAGGGNDSVTGGGEVYGANGRDMIRGAGFADGGRGADDLSGSEVLGGSGNDTIEAWSVGHGNDGADLMKGGKLYGDAGNDTITADVAGYGGDGKDLLAGPTVYGEDGNDTLEATKFGHGGAGDDIISGGGTLNGANGDDTLTGDNRTDDHLLGGRGADELHFALFHGNDVLDGGPGPDTYILDQFEPDDLPAFIDTADTIESFQHGLDKLDLTARDGIEAFDDLAIEKVGAFTTIKDSAGYLLVVVAGDDAANFVADDFIF